MRDKLSHLWVDWKVVLGRVVRASGGVSWGIVHVNGVCGGEISLGYMVHVYACEWRDLGRVIDYSRWASRRSRAIPRFVSRRSPFPFYRDGISRFDRHFPLFLPPPIIVPPYNVQQLLFKCIEELSFLE